MTNIPVAQREQGRKDVLMEDVVETYPVLLDTGKKRRRPRKHLLHGPFQLFTMP